jgi:colicin import membrane protein
MSTDDELPDDLVSGGNAPEAEPDVLAVADSIRSHYELPPESVEERERRWLELQIWKEEQRQLELERSLAYQAEQAEREAAAIAQQEARRRSEYERQRQEQAARQREQQQRDANRQRSDASLYSALTKQIEQAERRQLQRAAFGARRQSLSDALQRACDVKNPPPAPEPQVIVVEQPAEEETFCGVPIPRWRK